MNLLSEILNEIWDFLLSLRQTIGVWDVVDILVIAFIIYRVLSTLRRTSAGSVIKGVILVLVLVGISFLFNLTVLTYFIRQTFEMGIVVIVVLFQHEIRKLFERVGSSRLNFLFRRLGKDENIVKSIRSVVSACLNMSESYTGAIIVFEREVGLDDFAVTGTKIDAEVTPELIQNIFFSNSPLHDGALLIRSGRILAASCMLPLSNTSSFGRDIGMRHRAAIGLSERSDAVIVVVSEQTGYISVANDGMLKRQLDRETLELLLNNELISDGKKGKKLKTRNMEENL